MNTATTTRRQFIPASSVRVGDVILKREDAADELRETVTDVNHGHGAHGFPYSELQVVDQHGKHRSLALVATRTLMIERG